MNFAFRSEIVLITIVVLNATTARRGQATSISRGRYHEEGGGNESAAFGREGYARASGGI